MKKKVFIVYRLKNGDIILYIKDNAEKKNLKKNNK
jgi:hypothetical protein